MARETEEIFLKGPKIPPSRRAEYRIRSKEEREVMGRMTQVVNKVLEEGEEYYEVDVKTEIEGGDVMEESSILKIAETLRPVSCHLTTRNKDGKTLMETKIIYSELKPLLDSPLPSLSVCPVQAPGLSCVNILNCTPPGMVNFFLEGGPFILKGKSNLRMMVTEEEFLQIEEVKFSKEKVNVPAGDSECYKMEVTPDATPMLRNVPISVPDGLIKTMTQQFMPSIYRWFLVEEPHYLVKYEGFRCMGTPEKPVIAELVNIESRK